MEVDSEVLPFIKIFVPTREKFASLGKYLSFLPALHIGFSCKILLLNKGEKVFGWPRPKVANVFIKIVNI